MHPLRIALQLGISTFLLLSVPSSHLLQQDPSLTPTTAPPKKNLSCASQPFQLLQQLAYLHAQQRVGGTGPIRGLQGGGEGAKSRRCHDHTHTHPTREGKGRDSTYFGRKIKDVLPFHRYIVWIVFFSVGNSYRMVNPSPVAVRCDSRGGMRRRRRAAGGRKRRPTERSRRKY